MLTILLYQFKEKTVEAVSDFIEYIRDALSAYRYRPQALITDFVNEIDDYLIFLGQQMASEDNEVYTCLPNIDKDAIWENITTFRRVINGIYGEINVGSLIYISK